MDTRREINLKNLLENWPKGTVATMTWLKTQNISRFLKQMYIRSGWIQSIGKGAFVRNKEDVDWEGGLHALQFQLNLPVHVGGLSSLDLLGRSHYLKFGKDYLYLFVLTNKKIPKWFLNHKWSKHIKTIRTSLFGKEIGLITHTINGIDIKTASPERAAMELLYTAPRHITYEEASLIFEHLTQLRPTLIQELLEQCNSIKVKRLFLFLSEKHNLSWVKQLRIERIELGTSTFPLVKGGTFISKYKLMVPEQLAGNNEQAVF